MPLVSGAAIRFDGQVSAFDPSRDVSPWERCVCPETADFAATACAEMGVCAPPVGIVGSMQTAEALSLLAPIDSAETPCGRLLTVDAKNDGNDDVAGEARYSLRRLWGVVSGMFCAHLFAEVTI